MKLYVIGNGFDIGHGLPTKYWDFRRYLKKWYPDFLVAFEKNYDIYPNTPDDYKADMLWNEFETNLANINEDLIIEQAESMEMYLESGDIGIEDTLDQYFSKEFKFIKLLAKYLKQWVRTIRIRDTKARSTLITDDNKYINFNYTAVLENVYSISSSNIIHIHGSLRYYDIDPELGHGNLDRIKNMERNIEEAQIDFDEKRTSICRALADYYQNSFKDVSKNKCQLTKFLTFEYEEVCVIGHSLGGVDIEYFRYIDWLTGERLVWKVYYYQLTEKDKLFKCLIKIGIEKERIVMVPSAEFYDY